MKVGKIRCEHTRSFLNGRLCRRKVRRGQGSDGLLEEGSETLMNADEVEAVVDSWRDRMIYCQADALFGRI